MNISKMSMFNVRRVEDLALEFSIVPKVAKVLHKACGDNSYKRLSWHQYLTAINFKYIFGYRVAISIYTYQIHNSVINIFKEYKLFLIPCMYIICRRERIL